MCEGHAQESPVIWEFCVLILADTPENVPCMATYVHYRGLDTSWVKSKKGFGSLHRI